MTPGAMRILRELADDPAKDLIRALNAGIKVRILAGAPPSQLNTRAQRGSAHLLKSVSGCSSAVEFRTWNADVAGSIPAALTNDCKYIDECNALRYRQRMRVHEKIKAEIEKRKLSVTDAAPILGITRPSLSVVVNGRGALSIELALSLESEFGMDARKLLVAQLDEDIAAARAEIGARSP